MPIIPIEKPDLSKRTSFGPDPYGLLTKPDREPLPSLVEALQQHQLTSLPIEKSNGHESEENLVPNYAHFIYIINPLENSLNIQTIEAFKAMNPDYVVTLWVDIKNYNEEQKKTLLKWSEEKKIHLLDVSETLGGRMGKIGPMYELENLRRQPGMGSDLLRLVIERYLGTYLDVDDVCVKTIGKVYAEKGILLNVGVRNTEEGHPLLKVPDNVIEKILQGDNNNDVLNEELPLQFSLKTANNDLIQASRTDEIEKIIDKCYENRLKTTSQLFEDGVGVMTATGEQIHRVYAEVRTSMSTENYSRAYTIATTGPDMIVSYVKDNRDRKLISPLVNNILFGYQASWLSKPGKPAYDIDDKMAIKIMLTGLLDDLRVEPEVLRLDQYERFITTGRLSTVLALIKDYYPEYLANIRTVHGPYVTTILSKYISKDLVPKLNIPPINFLNVIREVSSSDFSRDEVRELLSSVADEIEKNKDVVINVMLTASIVVYNATKIQTFIDTLNELKNNYQINFTETQSLAFLEKICNLSGDNADALFQFFMKDLKDKNHPIIRQIEPFMIGTFTKDNLSKIQNIAELHIDAEKMLKDCAKKMADHPNYSQALSKVKDEMEAGIESTNPDLLLMATKTYKTVSYNFDIKQAIDIRLSHTAPRLFDDEEKFVKQVSDASLGNIEMSKLRDVTYYVHISTVSTDIAKIIDSKIELANKILLFISSSIQLHKDFDQLNEDQKKEMENGLKIFNNHLKDLGTKIHSEAGKNPYSDETKENFNLLMNEMARLEHIFGEMYGVSLTTITYPVMPMPLGKECNDLSALWCNAFDIKEATQPMKDYFREVSSFGRDPALYLQAAQKEMASMLHSTLVDVKSNELCRWIAGLKHEVQGLHTQSLSDPIHDQMAYVEKLSTLIESILLRLNDKAKELNQDQSSPKLFKSMRKDDPQLMQELIKDLSSYVGRTKTVFNDMSNEIGNEAPKAATPKTRT